MYTPNRWIMIKITTKKETLYKIFGSWGGGYLDGDSWRMNSGIEEIKEEEHYYDVIGYSGSIYRCFKGATGMTAYTASVLSGIIGDANKSGKATVEIVDIKEFMGV